MDNAIRSKQFSVAAGGTRVVDMRPYRFPATIAAIPGGGGTALVETSLSPIAADTPASATWFPWPSGAVAAAAQDSLEAPVVAVRLTATTQPAVFEVVG